MTLKTEAKQKADLKALSKAEILLRCKTVETRVVPVPGWDAGVLMKNLTFQELLQISIDAGDDPGSKNAMIVSAVCEELDINDAYKLQKGNGPMFAALYNAVDGYMTYKVTDEKIKN